MSSGALQHLWLLDQLHPGSCRTTVAFHLDGNVDGARLERALRALLERRPALRTRTSTSNGELERVVDSPQSFTLGRLRFAGDAAEAAQLHGRAEHARPLRLSQELPFRALLVHVGGAGGHVLVLSLHEIAGGRSAIAAILRELANSYASTAPDGGREDPASSAARDVASWREAPTPPSFEPLVDGRGWQAGAVADGCETLPFELDEIQELAAREGNSRLAVAVAATAALLESFVRQSEAAISIPVVPRADFAPVRLSLLEDLPFRDVVAAAQEAIDAVVREPASSLETSAHERCAREQQPMTALVAAPEPLHLELGGAVSRPAGEWSTPPFALSFELHEGAVRLRYSTASVPTETARTYLRGFGALLDAALANPGRRLSQLPVVEAQEERKVVVGLNATTVAYPRDRCVHQLFEEQVRSTPGAIALELRDQRITYADLEQRANALASVLRQAGVAPGDLVGLCAERGIEAIVAMIATLKAGAAYVPIDPGYPEERVAFMLEDAQARVLLATRAQSARLPARAARLILLDEIDHGAPERVSTPVMPSDVAYAMFTSGSTGRPKAVAVPHRAIVRLVKGANYARLGPDQVFLQAAPISFDASTLEIWGALLNGAKLAILPGPQSSLAEIGAAIRRHGVTILWLTAGLFHVMVDERLDDLRPLQQLLAGGDVLSVPHVRRVRRELPGLRLINGYGPTENTTFSCCHTIEDDPDGAVPIGKPISNSTAYVLDQRLRPVPVGIAGELFVGGDGLAVGYLRRPDLTAAKFVESRHGRLYRTGDLARWSPDGTIEFLGRIDTQVKVRGFRIELGEIESVLCQHPAVRAAAVAAREVGPNDRRLLAYVVLREPLSDAAGELRSWLSARVPEYMVPSAVAVLDKLPLGATGKVDRRALPEIDLARRAEPASPATGLERSLCGIWQGVLGPIRFGPNDNFFEIGGTSLQLVQVHSQIEQMLGRELKIMRLFEFPTVSSLARHLEPAPDAAFLASASGLGAAQERAVRQRAALSRQQASRRPK